MSKSSLQFFSEILRYNRNMNVGSGATQYASSVGNSGPFSLRDQRIIDGLVDAAKEGNINRVIRTVTANNLNILLAPHSKTGNTVLHAAIQASRVEVVATITTMLVHIRPVGDAKLETLLDRKNKENHSPLEVGGLTPAIKVELLAGLAKQPGLWPVCDAHKGYSVLLALKECGCSVCAECLAKVKENTKCGVCSRDPGTEKTTLDDAKIMRALQNVRKYSALFNEEDIPVCSNCATPAFPPIVSQCGHFLCFSCLNDPGSATITCKAKLDGFDHFCQQTVKKTEINDAITQRFIELFSSRTQYGLESRQQQLALEIMNNPRAAPELAMTTQVIDVFMLSFRTFTINGITVANCPHLTDRPDRYAVLPRHRIHKQYYSDDHKHNQTIEELEYRLELLPDKISKKLKKAMADARKQQLELEEKINLTGLKLSSTILDTKDLPKATNPLHSYITDNMPDDPPGVSIASSVGKRRTMEDAHIATRFTIRAAGKNVPVGLLGVFDGHRGDVVAKYAVQHVIAFLTQQLELYNANGMTDCGIWNAIKIGCVNLSRSCFYKKIGDDIEEESEGGSTACIALIINNVLWVANLGDSRAILVNCNGEDIQLSEDARAGNENYRRSIEKRCGCIVWHDGCDRIDGILQPARALGDHCLYGSVSARPKITRYPLTGFSGHLVLVSDGVTEALISSDIGKLVRAAGDEDNLTSVNIARRIVALSLDIMQESGADNMTAIVAPLGSEKQLAGCSGKMPVDTEPGICDESASPRRRKPPPGWRHRKSHHIIGQPRK